MRLNGGRRFAQHQDKALHWCARRCGRETEDDVRVYCQVVYQPVQEGGSEASSGMVNP